MNKKRIFLYIFFATILFFLYQNLGGYLLVRLTFYQQTILNTLIKYLKESNKILFLLFVFLYGFLHSFTPGHGKILLINSHQKDFFKLLKNTVFISIGQGITSYLIIYIFYFTFDFLSLHTVQKVDVTNFKIYGFIMIFLGIIGFIDSFFHLHNKKDFSILMGFFPCSGIINILMLNKLIGFRINSLFILVGFSFGIFMGLFFVILSKNILDKIYKKIKVSIEFSNFFNFLYFLIGIYLIFLY